MCDVEELILKKIVRNHKSFSFFVIKSKPGPKQRHISLDKNIFYVNPKDSTCRSNIKRDIIS